MESTGECNGRVEDLGGGAEVERLARAGVEPPRDRVELPLGVAPEVGPLRKVLPQQAVRVLVRAALPGAARIAEVDRHVRGE